MTQIVIPGKLPGMNEYSHVQRKSARCGAKMKRDTQKYILFCFHQQFPGGLRFDKPVIIGFEWYEPNRRRDIDNVCAAKKFILDALVMAKVIPNDSQKWLKQTFDELKIDCDHPRVVVNIKEAQNE